MNELYSVYMKKSTVLKLFKKAVQVYNLEGDKLFMENEKDLKKVDSKIDKIIDSMDLTELTIYLIAYNDLQKGAINSQKKDIHKYLFDRNLEEIEMQMLGLDLMLKM